MIVKELLDALDDLYSVDPNDGQESPYTRVYDSLAISDATAAHMAVRTDMAPHHVRALMSNMMRAGILYSYGSMTDDNITVYAQVAEGLLDHERIAHAAEVARLSAQLTRKNAEFTRKYS